MSFNVDDHMDSQLLPAFPLNLFQEEVAIGTVIKQAREDKGITQKQLASLCGISAVQLCRIENGESVPSQTTLLQLSKHIGISYSLLLIKAGYNYPLEKLQYYSKDGRLIDTDAAIASLYYIDASLLENIGNIFRYFNRDNNAVLSALFRAMRKEAVDIELHEKDECFVHFFSSLKKFIRDSIKPFITKDQESLGTK